MAAMNPFAEPVGLQMLLEVRAMPAFPVPRVSSSHSGLAIEGPDHQILLDIQLEVCGLMSRLIAFIFA